MASLGVIAALGPDRTASFGAPLRIGLSVVICTLFTFSWITEMLTDRARFVENQTAMRIGQLLHLFHAGYFDDHTVVFDETDWLYWRHRIWRWGVSPGTAVLLVLSVVLVALIWLL